MSNFVIIMGESGSGKSTSIKSLDPKETFIINTLGKRLPFKGSNSLYNADNKNIVQLNEWDKVTAYLMNIHKNAPHIHNIVIDDAIYIMRTEFFNRTKEKTYDKYNDLADHFRQIISTCSMLRNDLNVFMLLHTETLESEGSIIGYKTSSVGKLLDKMYNPVENVTIVLFAKPKFDDKGNPEFGFYTHKKLLNGIELPSKTPDGMFEEDFIPNDLGIVIKAMTEYYG